MVDLVIKDYDYNGRKILKIEFYKPRLLTLTSSTIAPDICIHDVSKEELEYISSELKRIADSME